MSTSQVSFRDPDGMLVRCGSRIFRVVSPNAAERVRRFLASAPAREWMARGLLCSSKVAPLTDCGGYAAEVRDGALVLEHEAIPFPNYPYEWAPAMLEAAGRLTLDMAEGALGTGYGLKDATPYNIMFNGCRPVFLDLLSFEEREPCDIVWRPYAQFMRTFIYPLLANRHFGIRLNQTLFAERDGLEAEQVRRFCSWWQQLTPPFFGAVTLPARLNKKDHPAAGYGRRLAGTADEAKYVLNHLFGRARKLLASGSKRAKSAGWSSYMESGHNYSDQEFRTKEWVVLDVLSRYHPETLLDIGCNTGYFSKISANAGTRVVAIDSDEDAVNRLWLEAEAAGQPILPLVVDIARPPGAVGWENGECDSFLDRANGHFPCVLMLALVHHLIVNERVPLRRLFALAAKLTTDLLLIEYIDPKDVQFRKIARGRESLHSDLNEESFESAASEEFKIAGSIAVSATRRLYTMRKRA